MTRIGIVGATGYGGRELLRLLAAHPEVEIAALVSTSQAGEMFSAVLPAFAKAVDVPLQPFDAAALARACDVVFVSVPGTESAALAAELRAVDARVIDLGPDLRLKDSAAFKQYYKKEHPAPELLPEAVYGLVPFYREQIKNAAMVAVPGCYPVSVLMPLKPLATAKFAAPIVVDAVSGVSGAGKALRDNLHFSEMNDNMWAYKVGAHQHTPEIEQELDNRVMVQFTPHVGPYTRGILSTITVRFDGATNLDEVYARYDDEPFVRVLGEGKLPDLNEVRASNYCDFGWVHDKRTGNVVIVSAIDNLVAGTAGMAIQCFNVMFGMDERTALAAGGMTV